MGRSNGTEDGISTVEGGSEPAIFIVGAPDTGKDQIAQALVERFTDLSYRVEWPEKDGYALGATADYRIELRLALERSLERPSGATIYTHSVLDNLAYLTFAISRYQLGTVSHETMQRTILAWTITGLILMDSFKHDHVFLLQGDFDPTDDYVSHEMQTILQMILDEYQINYSIIDINNQPVERIAETLGTYL